MAHRAGEHREPRRPQPRRGSTRAPAAVACTRRMCTRSSFRFFSSPLGGNSAWRPRSRKPHWRIRRSPSRKESPMSYDRVIIFDTTLRDGEQSPGISLNTGEKLEIAHQLARLGVDVIEAGFPIASPGRLRGRPGDRARGRRARSSPASRARSPRHRAGLRAVRDAERPRIHMFLSTSDIHIEHQLQSTREDVKGQARAAVAPRALAGATTSSSRRWTPRAPTGVHRRGAPDRDRRGRDDDQHPGHGRLRDAARVRGVPDRLYEPCPTCATSCSRSTATTTSAWPSPTRSPACRPARARSSARSTASASARATRRWRRS